MVSFVRFIMAAFLRTLLIIVYCLLLLTRAVIAGATLPWPASHQGHYDSNNGFTPSQVPHFPGRHHTRVIMIVIMGSHHRRCHTSHPASHQGHYDSNNGFTPSQKFASFQTIPLVSVVSNPVSKATLGKRLRDGMERIWTFLSA